VAVVEPVEWATTVITWVALPVAKLSGNDWGTGAAGGGAFADVLGDGVVGVGALDVGVGLGSAVLRMGVGAGVDEVAAVDGLRATVCLLDAPQAVSASAARTTIVNEGRRDMSPGCHATPMRMRGAAAGVSHCMIGTRLV
jgi:hypothetical protein